MSKEELVELLEYLKEQVSGPAEQVFRMAVQYQITSAIVWLIVGVGLGAGGLRLRTFHHRANVDNFDREFLAPLSVIGGWAAVLVGVVMVVVNIHSLINIEYVALRSLLP